MLAKVLGRYDVAAVRSHKQTLFGSSGFIMEVGRSLLSQP